MSDLSKVIMPDGLPFDETDWGVYSAEFVSKPVTIRAVRLECDAQIATLEGTMIGRAGDWLIEGTAGEFYPCKHEIFKAKYERKRP